VANHRYGDQIPYHTVNTTIRKTARIMSGQGLVITSSQEPWMKSLANTRTKVFANFRLPTGHDCLAKHLFHIGSFPHLYHMFCDQGEEMDRHLSVSCTAVY